MYKESDLKVTELVTFDSSIHFVGYFVPVGLSAFVFVFAAVER